MRWTGHLARVRDGSGAYRIWLDDFKEREHLEDLGLEEMIFEKGDGEARTA
jgi:hypothetical protein